MDKIAVYKMKRRGGATPLSAVLSRVGSSLKLVITGGNAPYTYSISGDVTGACGITEIETPDGTTSDNIIFTLFSYVDGYSSVYYQYSATVTDDDLTETISNIVLVSSCLAYGTKVITLNNIEKNIEDLVVNEFILDINGDFTKVLRVDKTSVDKIYNINNGMLLASESHLHNIRKEDGSVIQKQSFYLVNNDVLIDKDNNSVVIESVVIEEKETKVVDISTESKTYIANGIYTHNKIPCP